MGRKNLFLGYVKSALLFVVVVFALSAALAYGDVIIDEGGQGTSYTGTWATSSGSEPFGRTSFWARNGATYSWAFNSQPAGVYEVLMRWSGYTSRTTNAVVEIMHGQGGERVFVNQQDSPGRWHSIGRYTFQSSGSVTIVAANGDTISTCADAVWFRKLSNPWEVIIDNRDAKTSQTGNWGISGAPNPYGHDSVWSRDGSTFTWSFKPINTGNYRVSLRWTNLSSRGAEIPVTIEYASGSTSLYVDQTEDGQQWNDLGTYLFNADRSYKVTMTSPPGPSSGSADAIKFNLVESVNEKPETIIDNGEQETSSSGAWLISGAGDPFGEESLYGRDGATYNWFFTPPKSGYYEVSMWWTDWPSRSNAVPVDIENADGSLRVVVNQKLRGGTWNILEPLYFEAGRRYKTTIIGQPYPTSTCADAVKFGLVDTPPKKIVAMGDSITLGEGDNDSTDDISQDLRTKNGGFEPILNDLLTIETGDNYNIVNEGRGGTTSADGLALIPSLLARHPGAKSFLVQYGTNDARPWLPVPSGKGLNPGDDDYPGSFKDNMQRIIDAINFSDIEVCLAKPPITLGDGYDSIRYNNPDLGARSLLVKEYNEVIDELVADNMNKITIVPPDFYFLFNSVDPETGTKRYEDQYADNLHPNGEGYRSMAEVWMESLIR